MYGFPREVEGPDGEALCTLSLHERDGMTDGMNASYDPHGEIHRGWSAKIVSALNATRKPQCALWDNEAAAHFARRFAEEYLFDERWPACPS